MHMGADVTNMGLDNIALIVVKVVFVITATLYIMYIIRQVMRFKHTPLISSDNDATAQWM